MGCSSTPLVPRVLISLGLLIWHVGFQPLPNKLSPGLGTMGYAELGTFAYAQGKGSRRRCSQGEKIERRERERETGIIRAEGSAA